MSKKMSIWLMTTVVCCFAVATLSAQGWVMQTNPLGADTGLGKVQFVSPTEGWISASDGRLLHTTNAGTNWSVVTPFPNDTVTSMSDPSITMSWANQTHGWKMNWLGTGFADAHGAVIHKTSNGGGAWEKKVLSTEAGALGLQVQFVDTNNGWVSIYYPANDSMSTLRSTDGGDTWSPIETAGIFHFVDTNNGWACGTQSIYHFIRNTTNGGTGWSLQYVDSTPGQFQAIQFTDLNNGWAVGDSGKIIKTTDGGINWMSVANTGIHSSSKSKCIFFLNAAIGWIGTNDGIPDQNPDRIILYTDDGGSSWTKQNLPIAGAVFSIFFWDANNGWYAGEYGDSLSFSGIIAHTTNGGTGVEGKPGNDKFTVENLQLKVAGNTIKYQIPTAGRVSLKVFNLLGQEVRSLVNEFKSSGVYSLQWNGCDASKRRVSSGVYIIRLESEGHSATAKMVVVR
ncbi:MAG: T9SS type A sorting domain-containing protein [Candidatus Edwardsbacteria bacterium]|nr:T9SS type A sorting domain-containing protein [Candidatus Edwardsbacteria bacterium]MBU1576395.1 T9SS type A sorting domain-containing protein [Candidatus Edwardsbacteria bacterium]MBU2464030.1 T9SS type A sorting domain-containing protein [Candidatus Edwardsbacteria bacterium]MBU2593572.1 T9SS type A sorting domain-containing protein [Candidatus Edwardsbacteria bacterium]